MGNDSTSATAFSPITGSRGSFLGRFGTDTWTEKMHDHGFLVMGVVQEGQCSMETDDGTLPLSKGTVFVITPQQIPLMNLSKESCSGFMIFCTADEVTEMTGVLPEWSTVTTNDHLFRVRLESLVAAVDANAPAIEQQSRLAEALIRFMDRHTETILAPAPPAHAVTAKAKALMTERFAEPLTLDDLIRETGMNACSLGRAFSASMGMPPHEFLTFVRVRNARLMMHEANMDEAVTACGFTDRNHMLRGFMDVLGMTPSQYVQGCQTPEKEPD
jgi:AraC-like DNA-binding protein